MDQAVDLYRLKDKMCEMEKKQHTSTTKMFKMENALKEKADENKKLLRLINFYKRERTLLQKDNLIEENIKVRLGNNFNNNY